MAQAQRDLTSGELVALSAMILGLDPEDLKGVIVVGISQAALVRYASNMCCPKHALHQAEKWVGHLRAGEITGNVGEC